MITSPQDDLTAEREKVKGLREWAERKAKAGVQFISVLSDGEVHGLVAKLLQAEHARAVRIVREVVKHAAHMERQTKVNREMNAYWQGKLDGAENILAGLRKGRA